MREMVFANDDFDVHAHFAVTAEDFNDATRRSCAAARIAGELDVDDGAVQFRQTQAAAGTDGSAESSWSFARRAGVSSSPGGMMISWARRVS